MENQEDLARGQEDAPLQPARIRPLANHPAFINFRRNAAAGRHVRQSRIYEELRGMFRLRWLFGRSMYQCLFNPQSNRADDPQQVRVVPAAYQLFKLAFQGPAELLFHAYQSEMRRDRFARWHNLHERITAEQGFQMIQGWIVFLPEVDDSDDEGFEDVENEVED